MCLNSHASALKACTLLKIVNDILYILHIGHWTTDSDQLDVAVVTQGKNDINTVI